MNENSSVRRCVARVIFLGTGDPLNEQRAQTSLAVPLSGSETMLIDASSGTILLRQLEAAGIPLETVRHLFVAHLHFDHVGGLAPLLTAMASLSETSLSVHAGDAFGPQGAARAHHPRRRGLARLAPYLERACPRGQAGAGERCGGDPLRGEPWPPLRGLPHHSEKLFHDLQRRHPPVPKCV